MICTGTFQIADLGDRFLVRFIITDPNTVSDAVWLFLYESYELPGEAANE